MTQIKEFVREYADYDKNGLYVPFKVTYSVVVKNNELTEVRNSSNAKVKEGSDCWDFISNNLKTIMESKELLTLK